MSLRPGSRAELRRNRYKVAVDADEGRRRREDNLVEIRKAKREESLLKKRREGLHHHQFSNSLPSSALEKQLENLPSMVAGIWSNDNNLQFEATMQFRKLLSIDRSPPIEEVMKSGAVPRLVEFLVSEDCPNSSLKLLTSIASGTSENTRSVVDNGAVPIFVKLLYSPSDDIRDQAVWTLGNGALVPLLPQLNKNSKLSMLRNATRTLFN